MTEEEMEVEPSRKRRRTAEVPRKKTRRRVQDSPTAIQRLFLACRSVFKGPGTVPPPVDVGLIQLLLDKMSPDDFGLRSDLLFLKSRISSNGTPRITYTEVYKCDNFSLCILVLPKSAVIPLHNHPGMTVFNKLLLGSMHIKSYDWVDPVQSEDLVQTTKLRLARLVVDSVFTAPCKSSILYPTSGGNIHTFTAITPCVVLDVLGPPYLNEDGHDCTYYEEHPFAHLPSGTTAGENDDKKGWLEEINIPRDLFHVVEYLGPKIVDG